MILCHHTGKDRSQGLRGHSSLHAAMDAEIELRTKTRYPLAALIKLKDEKDGTGYGFRLVQHV